MKKGYWLFLSPALFVTQISLAEMSVSETQIREVIEQFRTSIINKDKETFSSLFFSDDVPFIAVFSDEMLSSKRMERPDYPAAVDFGKFGPPAKPNLRERRTGRKDMEISRFKQMEILQAFILITAITKTTKRKRGVKNHGA